ncbi:unnamed protein product, partial [Strongylus vulgaris]
MLIPRAEYLDCLFSLSNFGEETQPICKEEKEEHVDVVISEVTRSTSEPVSNNTGTAIQSAAPAEKRPSLEPAESWKTHCGFCDGESTDLFKPTFCRNHYLILLACMIMDQVLDLSQALEAFWKVSHFTVVICKKHILDAAERVRKENQRLWGIEPEQWPDDVPSPVTCEFADLVNSYAHRIDVDRMASIRLADIKEFYFSCQKLFAEDGGTESEQNENRVTENEEASLERDFQYDDQENSEVIPFY